VAGRVRYYAGAGQDPEPPGHTCSYQETEMKERERGYRNQALVYTVRETMIISTPEFPSNEYSGSG